MTEDQLKKWQARRDEAKRIEDPVAREKALDLVYDLKDDMQLDCQRKMADRIKKLVENDQVQYGEICEVKSSIAGIKLELEQRGRVIDEDHETVQSYRESRLRWHGALTLAKWGYLVAAALGALVTWAITVFGGK